MRLDKQNKVEVTDRFYNFDDGVVCSLCLDLRATPQRCEVVIQAQDREAASGWSNLRFVIEGVSERRFQLGKSTFEVLSGGIQLGWVGDLICVVFDAYPDDGPGLPDLRTNTAYVIGSTCDIEIQQSPVRMRPSGG